MGNVAAVLQYGALGLLAVVIAGFFWYVRSVEARAAKREEAEQERQTTYIEAIIKSTATLAVIASRMQAHDSRMQQEHQAVIDACKFSRRGIGEQ